MQQEKEKRKKPVQYFKMNKFLLYNLILLLSLPLQAANILFTDEAIDSETEVELLNNHLNLLNNSKLDLKPGNIIPKKDSFYTLGDVNHKWLSLHVDTITVTQIFHKVYKKPTLKFIDANTVDIEANTETANETCLVVKSGEQLCVTEDTSSTTKYRRFLITASAEFTSGTEDSGLISTESEPTNHWIPIYAVKSQINSSNFVLVGTTETTPIPTNFSSLNTLFGTDNWLYIGTIRNGDNVGEPTEIVDFNSGTLTTTFNIVVSSITELQGVLIHDEASASVTFTPSAGVSAAAVPSYFTTVFWGCGSEVVGQQVSITAATNSRKYYSDYVGDYLAPFVFYFENDPFEGVAISHGSNDTIVKMISIGGFRDGAR